MKEGRGSFLVAAWLAALIVSPAAFAGGGQHYPNGAEDCFSGIAPPPGWHIVNYINYYDGEQTVTTPAGPLDIGVNTWAEVFRVIYSSDKKIFGGNWLCHLFVPYVDVDVDPIGSASGVADPIIDPFIIAWHGQTYHAVAGVDLYVPIGLYHEDELINVGKNFWTIEPVFAITGLYQTGWSWSLKLMYDFNTKNDEYLNPGTMQQSELEPGDEVHLDYSLDFDAMQLSEALKGCRLGVCGYYYRQIDDDQIDGVDVPDDKGEAFAVGPVFMYSPSKNLHLVAKAQFEVETDNRPEGNSYWFKLIYSF